jgi:hypothetical protein
MLRLACALLVAGACCAARADPAVAQFAGAQLGVAEAALEAGRAALAVNDYAAARRYAAQASLDARLAWGMTESQALRLSAIEINRRAQQLRWQGLMAGAGGLLADR